LAKPGYRGWAFVPVFLSNHWQGKIRRFEGVAMLEAVIYAVLHTIPGQRVNRPSFGSHLTSLVFENQSPAFFNQINHAVSEALTRELGDVLLVDNFEFSPSENPNEVTYKLYYKLKSELGERREISGVFASSLL